MKRVLGVLAIILGAIILLAPFAFSTVEYSKKEEKQCVYCHTAMGKPDLNDAGKWYKDHDHTFKGWEEKEKEKEKEKKKP